VPGRKVAPDPEYLVRANTLAGYWDIHRRLVKNLPKTPPTAQMADSLVDDSSKLGERSSLKKTIVGRHCVIGRGAKLSGCVIWDFCTIDEK
jgi:translation initiation factor eIF-2B subunit gamma